MSDCASSQAQPQNILYVVSFEISLNLEDVFETAIYAEVQTDSIGFCIVYFVINLF